MKRLRRLTLALAAAALLTAGGCTSMPDIQSNAYATAIGIDYKDGQWIAYAQVINFTTIAHTDQVEVGKATPVWVGMGKGDTVSSALVDVGNTSQMKMFWGHVKAAVVSEEAMRKSVQDIYSAVNRYREVRYTVYVFGTNRDIREVLTQKSLLNQSPLNTSMFTGSQASSENAYLIPETGNQIIAYLNEPGESAFVPSIGVDEGSWSEDTKPRPMFKLTGGYFFRGNKLAGWMSAQDLMGRRWAEKKVERTPITIKRDGKPLALLMFSHPKLKVQAYWEDGEAKFRFRVRAQGFVMELMNEASIDEMKARAEEAIREEMEMTFAKGVKWGCDPFGVMQELYRTMPEKFHKLTDGGRFHPAANSLTEVKVDVKLINTGKYQGTPP